MEQIGASGEKRPQGFELAIKYREYLENKKEALEAKIKSNTKSNLLAAALADGKVSDDELVELAKIEFSRKDVAEVLSKTNLHPIDKSRLLEDLMTRVETYRKLNNERKGQKSGFGL